MPPLRVTPGLSSRHLQKLSETMRPSDVAEVRAWGLEPTRALELSAQSSTEVYTVLDGDQVVMAFGVGPKPMGIEPAYGIWMMSSPLLERHSREVARGARHWLAVFQRRYGVLWNLAYRGNDLHVRWIKWLRFTVEAPEGGSPWMKFTRRSERGPLNGRQPTQRSRRGI